MKGLERVTGDQNIANSHDKAMNAMNQAADDRVNLQLRLDRLDQSNTAISSGIQESTATVREMFQLKDMLTLHLQSLRPAPASLAMSEESARISLTLTLPKLGISTRDSKVLLKRLSGDHTWILSNVVLHLSERHHFGSSTNHHYLEERRTANGLPPPIGKSGSDRTSIFRCQSPSKHWLVTREVARVVAALLLGKIAWEYCCSARGLLFSREHERGTMQARQTQVTPPSHMPSADTHRISFT